MEERVHISTPDHVSLEFELAGPGSRFSAYAIDFLFNILLIVVIALAVYASGAVVTLRSLDGRGEGQFGWSASWILALLVLIIFLINWGYYVFFEGLGKGSTPGKKRMGIRVIRQDGLPIGLREAALRNLVRAADMLPPPSYILGGLVMHFDPQGRRLGDMVAGTYVVVEKFDIAAQGVSGAAWAKRVEQGRSRQALTLAARHDFGAAVGIDRAVPRPQPRAVARIGARSSPGRSPSRCCPCSAKITTAGAQRRAHRALRASALKFSICAGEKAGAAVAAKPPTDAAVLNSV